MTEVVIHASGKILEELVHCYIKNYFRLESSLNIKTEKEIKNNLCEDKANVKIYVSDCSLKVKSKEQEIILDNVNDLGPILLSLIKKEKKGNKGNNALTERETEILQLISNGMSNKEIATELNITERTVKNHITNLFKKINVLDRTQAALYAIKKYKD